MWDFGYNEEAMVNLRDSVPGIVKGQSRSGLYIDSNIENDFDDRWNSFRHSVTGPEDFRLAQR